MIPDNLVVGQHLAKELHFAGTQGAALAFTARPGQVESDQLPERIKAQAAGHDRVTLEMALEEPQLRIDVELGSQTAFAEFAVTGVDVCDAVEHQHLVNWQAHVAGEELAVPAFDQVGLVEMVWIHGSGFFRY